MKITKNNFTSLFEDIVEEYQGKLAVVTSCTFCLSDEDLEEGEVVLILKFSLSEEDDVIHMTCLSKTKIVTDWFYLNIDSNRSYLNDYYRLIEGGE